MTPTRFKSVDDLVTEAKALWEAGKYQSAKVSAILAASKAQRVEQCPFGGEKFAQLAGEWINYFRIKDEAKRRQGEGERPAFKRPKTTASAAPPAQSQTAAAPKPQHRQTTSAAYAEQMGWDTAEERI